MSAAKVIGVLGTGTMGGGIAQLGCRAEARTLLFDPEPDALDRAQAKIAADFEKLVGRGKLAAEEAEAAKGRLEVVSSLADLAACDLIVEAVPESLDLKRRLIAELDTIVTAGCVLATNTSSLLVTAVAAGSAHPERVVGMHFFNPPPVMRLLEVVAGEASSAAALARAEATGSAMGKEVIRAKDGPGFLVNRSNRPYSLEALKLLSDGVASVEDIDRAVRGAGFRMGPFELADLVGIDVGFEVAQSFFEQSFAEARWRPSPLTARYVAAGYHGRKTKRGFYRYDDGPHRADDPAQPPIGGGAGTVAIAGDGTLADELRATAAQAGWTVTRADERSADVVVDCRIDRSIELPDGPRLVLCDTGSLAVLDAERRGAAGFFVLPPLARASSVELTRTAATQDETAAIAERFFGSLGKNAVWVGDAPGLVIGRIVCQVINESCFALTEDVGTSADIDKGLVLALNHPRGALEWSRLIGLERVLATLDALQDELRDDRYRAAPIIRSRVAQGLQIP